MFYRFLLRFVRLLQGDLDQMSLNTLTVAAVGGPCGNAETIWDEGIWVCLKMLGELIPNEIAIFHRDNDQQNHWV